MKKSFINHLGILAFSVIISCSACWPDAKKQDNAAEMKRVSDSIANAKSEKAIRDSIANAAQAYLNGTAFEAVTIGNQTWTKQNLNVSTFRNGDPIPEARTNEEWKEAGRLHKAAWCYYKNSPNSDGIQWYGKLYNWWAVIDKRGLAPKGFHIPKQDEWNILLNFLGEERRNSESTVVGGKLRSENGFNATFVGGYRYGTGTFSDNKDFADKSFGENWWSCSDRGFIKYSDEDSTNQPVSFQLQENNVISFNYAWHESYGMSVRCIKGVLDSVAVQKSMARYNRQDSIKFESEKRVRNEKENLQSTNNSAEYNQGVEDETKCLQGGITPSITEERAVFDVKFPNGTDADFQNYKNGCQHAFYEWKSKGN